MISLLEKKRIIPILLTIIIALNIFFFSSIPGEYINNQLKPISVFYHFFIFFLLSFFLFISITGQKNLNLNSILIVILFCLFYAILDEFHQIFVTGRTADILDILTDLAGILTSIILYSIIKLKKIH